MEDYELVAGYAEGTGGQLDAKQKFVLQSQVDFFRARLVQGWVPADVIRRVFKQHAQRKRFKQQWGAASLIGRAYRMHRKRVTDYALCVLGPFLIKVSRNRQQRIIRRLQENEKQTEALRAKVNQLEALLKTFSSATPFNIKNVHSSRYLNIKDGSLNFATNVQLWDNPESSHSRWVISFLPEISNASSQCLFSVKSVRSGRCLSVRGLEQKGNVMTHFRNVGNRMCSVWELKVVETGSSKYNFRNVQSGLYLNVAEWGSRANGANVQQYDNPENTHSQWEVQAVEPSLAS